MFNKKLLTFLLFVFSISSNFAQFTDVINSNRPGKSMSAFSVGKTIIQAEMGVNYNKETDENADYDGKIWSSDLTLRYGVLYEQLEVLANLDYLNETRSTSFSDIKESGLKKVTLGAKYLVYDPDRDYEKKPNLYSWKANHQFNWRQFIPAVALYGGINFNLARDKFQRLDIPKDNSFSLKGMILTQNQFGRYTFLTNIIVDKFPSQTMSFDYVLTMTRGFNSRVSGFFEIQGLNDNYYRDNFLRVGAAYLLKQNLQIDASVGRNFKGDPSIIFGGIGASWRFDANYEDIFLRIPKEDKRSKLDKKSDKLKDKKKEKSKKRLDSIEDEKPK
jgi:hypothetical protein